MSYQKPVHPAISRDRSWAETLFMAEKGLFARLLVGGANFAPTPRWGTEDVPVPVFDEQQCTVTIGKSIIVALFAFDEEVGKGALLISPNNTNTNQALCLLCPVHQS